MFQYLLSSIPLQHIVSTQIETDNTAWYQMLVVVWRDLVGFIILGVLKLSLSEIFLLHPLNQQSTYEITLKRTYGLFLLAHETLRMWRYSDEMSCWCTPDLEQYTLFMAYILTHTIADVTANINDGCILSSVGECQWVSSHSTWALELGHLNGMQPPLVL